MVIYALVEASTHDDALVPGKRVFDHLVSADPHGGAVFDYYVTFDEEDTSVAGKARCEELPTAAPIDSEGGQDLLERGWEATKEEFERNLERVKQALDELSDEEIMRDEDLARYAFHKVGAYDGSTIFLYTEHGTAFATVDSWTDSLRRVRNSGSYPPTSTFEYGLHHQLATQEPLAGTRVTEHRNWCASRLVSSTGPLSVQMAWHYFANGYSV